MKVQDKVWVVTGGGSGIGRHVVLQLLERGSQVAAVDLRAENLEETSRLAAAGRRLSTHVLDITDRRATESLPGDVIHAHGSVDGLLNNAGIIQPFEPVSELTYDAIDRVLNVNLMGTIYMVKSFLPILLARPEAHLANVSSMGGFFPFPGQTIYGASKAAVKLLTEGLYAELLESPVNVSVVMPGAVATEITEHSGVELDADPGSSRIPQTSPEKAARIIIDGIERNRLHIFVGMDARLMDVAIKIAPTQATKFVRNRMAGLLPD